MWLPPCVDSPQEPDRTKRQLLDALANGPRTAVQLFLANQEREEAIFLGDTWAYLFVYELWEEGKLAPLGGGRDAAPAAAGRRSYIRLDDAGGSVVDTAEAARRWAAEWQRAWEEHDSDRVAALYAEGASFRSAPFRDLQDPRALCRVGVRGRGFRRAALRRADRRPATARPSSGGR